MGTSFKVSSDHTLQPSRNPHKLIIMNPKVFLGLALAACAINSAAAIVGFSSLGLTASSAGSSAGLTGLVGGAAVGSPLFVTGSGFVLAGIVGLKALALHNILEAQSRKKR